MLETRNTPADNYRSTAELPVNMTNMFTTIYVYSLYGNINMNYGNYVLL